MALLGPVALFFLLFALPSSILAVLAEREFLLRRATAHEGEPGHRARVRRARWLLLGAAALPLLLVIVTTLATQYAPLQSRGGWVFLGYGVVAGALGPIGSELFVRAAGDPRPRLVKAAETVPMLLVMLNLVLVANAAMQVPG